MKRTVFILYLAVSCSKLSYTSELQVLSREFFLCVWHFLPYFQIKSMLSSLFFLPTFNMYRSESSASFADK